MTTFKNSVRLLGLAVALLVLTGSLTGCITLGKRTSQVNAGISQVSVAFYAAGGGEVRTSSIASFSDALMIKRPDGLLAFDQTGRPVGFGVKDIIDAMIMELEPDFNPFGDGFLLRHSIELSPNSKLVVLFKNHPSEGRLLHLYACPTETLLLIRKEPRKLKKFLKKNATSHISLDFESNQPCYLIRQGNQVQVWTPVSGQDSHPEPVM